MKKLCLLLAAVFLLLMIPAPIAQAADSGVDATYAVKLSTSEGLRGDQVNVDVVLNLSAEVEVNGIEITVEFDDRMFDYNVGSAKAAYNALKNATIYYNGSGKVEFVWTNLEGVTLPTNQSLFTLSLVVAEDASASSSQVFAYMDRLYQSEVVDGQIVPAAIDCTTGTAPIFTVVGADQDVKNAINLIAAIGQVTYDAECMDRISAAANAYHTLTVTQKEQVTNYRVLVAAQEMYRTLQAGGILPADVQALIDGFLQEHSEVLSLTTEIISNTSDPVALYDKITAALEDYANLTSPHAQAELVGERTMLRRYQALLQEKVDQLLNEQQEAEYKRQAEEEAAKFREDFEYTLSLTTETVRTFDEGNVTQAWNSYEAISDLRGVGPYFAELMVEEAALMRDLKAKIAELKIEENPEIAQEILNAQKYKEQFATILALKPEDLVYEDVLDVSLAYMMLEMLDDATLALLEEEQAIVEALYDAAMELSPEDNIIIEVVDNSDQEAEDWKDTFANVLNLTTDTLTEDDVLDVMVAQATLELLSDSAQKLLENEKILVDQLADRAQQIVDLSDTTTAVNQWKDRFADVLELDPETLTKEDAAEVKQAKLALELLSDEARELLSEEKALVDALYEKALILDPDKEIITETIEKVIEKLVEKNVRVDVVKRGTSITIWILLALAVIAVVLYLIIKKIYHGKGQKGGQ